MAFKRTTTRTFSADVKVPVAREDGGYDMNTFKAVFEHTTTEETEKLRELSNSDLVRRKLKGWELTDAETKEDVPFTPENLEAILQIPPSPMKICIAFWEQVNGARAKNS
jgi:hypothetical protein